MKKIIFLDKEKTEIANLFENGMGLVDIAKIFECSFQTIQRNLIDFLGKEKYKKITKEHLREAGQKITFNFTDKEKTRMAEFFKNGMFLIIIAKIFGCGRSTIGQNLIDFLGEEKYKKIAKEHLREVHRETGRKNGKLPATEKTKEAAKENFKKAQKASQKNHSSIYEKNFKLALENKNFEFESQKIIDFPAESFIKYCIVDFFVNPNLIVEVDGWSHGLDPTYDEKRDKICKELGFKVLRFTHEEVQNNLILCINKVLRWKLKN